MTTFFLATGIVLVLWSVKETSHVQKLISGYSAPTKLLPKAVSLLIVSAQLSELVNVVEHTTVVHVSAALLLLAIVVATKSGTGGEVS